jgi:FtsH-binding integral membrane protein
MFIFFALWSVVTAMIANTVSQEYGTEWGWITTLVVPAFVVYLYNKEQKILREEDKIE